MLIILLIIFFLCLIIYQLYQVFLAKVFTKEGFIYRPYTNTTTVGPANSSSLIQQNINNIQELEEEVGPNSLLLQEINDISMNVIALNEQVKSLVQAQANAAQQLKPINTTN